jgi:hypothetical protein
MEVFEALRTMRAVRREWETLVPDAAVPRIVEAGRRGPSGRSRTARHASVKAVRLARPTRPPLSGLFGSRRCVTAPAGVDQSSRSKIVPGGLKLNSCQTSSR